jgi:flagellin-like hook-associated protein FlgL
MVDRVQTSAIRSKLLPLRQTSDPSLKRQTSVAAGNANSARDKRVSVLTAADLAVRIRDLSAMIEKLAMAIDAIQAADHSISAITELVRLAQALVRRAQETTDVTVRATLAGQFDALLPEIDLLAGRANVNGINLLGGNDLTISRSEDARAAVTVASFKAAANDLAIKPSQKNWATIADIDLAAAEVKLATVVLRSQAQALRSSRSTLQIRQDFAKAMFDTLQTGMDNLTSADCREERANLLALQGRQHLSTTALSMAAQAGQNVLRLF